MAGGPHAAVAGASMRSQPVRFVLLSTQRSGTSWVLERLSAHPQVGGYGEVLLEGVEGWSDWPPGAKDRPFYTTYLKERGALGSRVQPHRHLFRYLDYLYEPRRSFKAIGFKLMYTEAMRYPEVLLYLRSRGVRVLHLVRANLLDVYLSREALPLRRFAHARSLAEREPVRLEIDTSRLPRELARIQREQRVARGVVQLLRLKTHEITYEAALQDDAALHAALRFIGVDTIAGHELSPIMLKLAPNSQREALANFDEVAATLAGTRFERFLRA